MTFCCAEKTFKLLTQFGAICHRQTVTVLTPDCHRFDANKRPVENRDFVDFCAKSFVFLFENGRVKLYLCVLAQF